MSNLTAKHLAETEGFVVFREVVGFQGLQARLGIVPTGALEGFYPGQVTYCRPRYCDCRSEAHSARLDEATRQHHTASLWTAARSPLKSSHNEVEKGFVRKRID